MLITNDRGVAVGALARLRRSLPMTESFLQAVADRSPPASDVANVSSVPRAPVSTGTLLSMCPDSAIATLNAESSPEDSARLPPTRAHDAIICGVPTHFVLTRYSNRIMVVASQTDNMGTIITAHADNFVDAVHSSYSTRVLIGKRDDPHLEAYARTLVEMICKRAPDAPPLLLCISIREHSKQMFHSILREIDEHRVW